MDKVSSRTLLDIVRRPSLKRPAFTVLGTREVLTWGELYRAAYCQVIGLRRFGIGTGERILCLCNDPLRLMPLVIAALELGAELQVHIAEAGNGCETSFIRKARPKLIVTDDRSRHDRGGEEHVSRVGFDELERLGIGQPWLSDAAKPPSGRLGAPRSRQSPAGELSWTTHQDFMTTAANLAAAYDVSGNDTMLAAATAMTLDGLCAQFVIPMTMGVHTVLAGEAEFNDPAALWAAAEANGATICQVPACGLQRVFGRPPAIPPHQMRFMLVAPGTVSRGCLGEAAELWRRPVHQGWGAPNIGGWAAHTSHDQADRSLHVRPEALHGVELAVRPLRVPLHLLSAEQSGTEAPLTGELVLRQDAAAEHRTGDIGQIAADGTLTIFGKLADIAIRAGRGVLLTDIDAVLSRHPGVVASKTIHEHGVSPVERVVTACATELCASELAAWIREHAGAAWLPDEIVALRRLPAGEWDEVPTATLRAMVNGTAARAVIAALTGRKFRRNACHKEAALQERVQSAILTAQPLEFLAFWGCGPRRDAAMPDLIAMDALREFLGAVAEAAPLRAHLNLVCTDVHAASNGHDSEHFESYFSQIAQMASQSTITMHRESAVWHQGGLALADVTALAATPAFEATWQAFPLKDRFLLQASRHSKATDREAAARRYYATCLLERDVFKAVFPTSTFLTYNGPEFNECFPDLPTLYIYPGPRGKTVKPWFVTQTGDSHDEAEPIANLPARLCEPSLAR